MSASSLSSASSPNIDRIELSMMKANCFIPDSIGSYNGRLFVDLTPIIKNGFTLKISAVFQAAHVNGKFLAVTDNAKYSLEATETPSASNENKLEGKGSKFSFAAFKVDDLTYQQLYDEVSKLIGVQISNSTLGKKQPEK